MSKVYQSQLSISLRPGLGYNFLDGPTSEIEYLDDYVSPFNSQLFVHMFVMGRTGSGKGIFSTTLGLWLHDNFGFKFIDTNDGSDFENGCYGWKQEDETMLARLEDTFFLNTPHAYKHEMLFPLGFLDEYPKFFTPFCVSYKDLTVTDFKFFYPSKSSLSEKKEPYELLSHASKSESIEEFYEIIEKKYKEIAEPFRILIEAGFLTDETLIDLKAINDPAIIHSVATNFINCPDDRVQGFILSLTVRMIQDSRQSEYKQTPMAMYIREATMLEDTMFRQMATKGRHTNTHMIVDTQRRVSMLDKTAAQQFGSFALFTCKTEMVFEYITGFGLPEELAFGVAKADTGIGALQFEGMHEPYFPEAISPCVSGYKNPKQMYMDLCRSKGIRFESSTL